MGVYFFGLPGDAYGTYDPIRGLPLYYTESTRSARQVDGRRNLGICANPLYCLYTPNAIISTNRELLECLLDPKAAGLIVAELDSVQSHGGACRVVQTSRATMRNSLIPCE
jgi:hypothetical protein